MIFKKIKQIWNSIRVYAILDPRDNSVTLSKQLFKHIKDNATTGDAKVFVFRTKQDDSYGFTLDPDIDQPTQMCDIQYNGKYKCVGFESLCPSVGSILYHYDLSAIKRVKLSVSIDKLDSGMLIYKFDKPNAKHTR